MAEITAKVVKVQAPAGTTANFMAANGTYHQPVALPLSIIKKLLDQGAVVKELVDEVDEETEEVVATSEVELTVENYTSDLGGREVPEGTIVVADIEDEVALKHEEEAEARLEAIGLEIKAKQDKLIEENTAEEEGGGGEGGEGFEPGPELPPVENPEEPATP